MKKILVIQTAFLGDAILTLPLIQHLKEKFISSEITVLCIPNTSTIFEHSKYVSNVIVYDKKGREKSIISFFKIVRKISKQNFDEVYSPHRSFRSTIISFFSGANKTFGFDKANFSFLYKSKIKYKPEDHEVKRNLSLANFDFEQQDWKILPKIEFNDSTKETVEKALSNIDNKIIAIAPGSVWQTKIYPKNYFIQIINELIKKEYFVVLLGGKEDEKFCNEIKLEFSEKIISFAGKLNIIESTYLLKKCSGLICNDSAPTHMAMIADIPVLTIYCSTTPNFGFYPYNNKSSYISFDDLKCKPCGIHGHNVCPIKTFECGYKLIPELVIEKLKEIITV